jgi:hypothetical protein
MLFHFENRQVFLPHPVQNVHTEALEQGMTVIK